jgi:hypothetical protein
VDPFTMICFYIYEYEIIMISDYFLVDKNKYRLRSLGSS